MAKIMPGVSLSALLGRCGSIVFGKNQAGANARQYVTPRQPHSPDQAQVRGPAVTLSKRWGQTLNDTQRSGWIALAAAHPRTDQFLRTYHLTGMQLYLAINQALKAIGLPTIDDPPLTWGAGTPGTLTTNWTPGTLTLTISPTTPPTASEVPVIWASAMLSPGKRSTKFTLAKLCYFAAGDAGPWDISTAYQAKHGTFTLFKTISLMARYTSNANGCQGTPQYTQQFLSP